MEIARRILKEARRGVRFDEMAVFVRSPQSYFGLLEHALRRAEVPAWFDRGTRRPHPAGRAFLALLACAAEHLSASRFAEYLSLGQVPAGGSEGEWTASQDEALGLRGVDPGPGIGGSAPEAEASPLRAPWRWERVLIDAAVIGQDSARWKRRLEGWRRELELQIAEVERDEGVGAARGRVLDVKREQCEQLTAFALPIIEELAAWPAQAT